jgi:hypothetical protein
MTSVLDEVDCEQCHGRAFYEFQTRTLTESIFCPRCGYQEETRPIRKRKTKDGEPVYRTRKRPGMGAYMLKGRNGVSEIGALSRPLTARVTARFKQNLTHPHVDAAHSFLTRWNPKSRRVEMVIGKFPHNLP